MSRPVTLAVVGDLFPSRSAFDGDRARDPAFAEVVALLREADVSFGNFEIPLSDRGAPVQKMITIRTTPSMATSARSMGLDVVSLANNHILDYGHEALIDTINGLRGSGVLTVGAGADLAGALEPAIVDVEGTRFGFLAWSTLLPTGAAASPDRPGIAPLEVRTAYEVDPVYLTEEPTSPPVVRSWVKEDALQAALAHVREVRANVDFLVVSIHWGVGVGEGLAEFQQPLGHALIDAGADVVAGHHPHSIHGVEIYGGRPIFYSPGLFLEQVPREGVDEDTLALYALLSPDSYIALISVVDGSIAHLRLIPTSSNVDGLPERARGEVAERISQRLTALSRPLDTDVRPDDDELSVTSLIAAEPLV